MCHHKSQGTVLGFPLCLEKDFPGGRITGMGGGALPLP